MTAGVQLKAEEDEDEEDEEDDGDARAATLLIGGVALAEESLRIFGIEFGVTVEFFELAQEMIEFMPTRP